MTLTEKRELLIKEIQQMDEQDLDTLLAALSSKTENGEGERSQRIEAIIKNNFKRYHKVFKALS